MEGGTKGGCESFHGVRREGQTGPGSWGHVGTMVPRARNTPGTDESEAGKHNGNGSHKNSASSALPWPPKVLHLSFMVIKAQQSH